MDTGAEIGIPDIAAGNAGFVIAQALLEALIKRRLLRVEDVAPMLQEVVDIYRQPAAEGREALNASMADVLAAVLERHRAPRR